MSGFDQKYAHVYSYDHTAHSIHAKIQNKHKHLHCKTTHCPLLLYLAAIEAVREAGVKGLREGDHEFARFLNGATHAHAAVDECGRRQLLRGPKMTKERRQVSGTPSQ